VDLFSGYRIRSGRDEMFTPDLTVRPPYRDFLGRVQDWDAATFIQRQETADLDTLNSGITFTVYNDDAGTERIFPFSLIPRIIAPDEWNRLERGLVQRVTALNRFLVDIYGAQDCVSDGVIPPELVFDHPAYRLKMAGFCPPLGVYAHIAGIDLIRDAEGVFRVLEDNLRTPSGVSYVLENRDVMKRTFPQAFDGVSILPVEEYPEQLLQMLQHIAPAGVRDPNVVVLTPGIYNSAYFEHCFLALQMGVELVQGSDLTVSDGFVYMRTTRGLERVDVIYRRIDDDFLDPKTFRPDSALGVPGLMDVYRAGRVALANAPGTGIADDKAVYAYVPQIIRYYLNEEIILPNVPSYVCGDPQQCEHVLANLDELVIKPTNESGGYGILLGPRASQSEREQYRELIRQRPRDYIAQPMLSLSRVPTIVHDRLEGRHVDLRPYILYGKDIYVLPGGLTRVALKKGSLVVNSSQGGGSKDRKSVV